MSRYRTNNITGTRCKMEQNARGGYQQIGGQGNHINGTLQYSGRKTTLTADINSSATTIAADTTTFAPSGWAVIESEVFWYAGITGTAFTGCARGAKSTTAASHTTGARISQGVGYHVVGGDAMASSFNGHFESNLWHAFIEAGFPSTPLERPRGITLDRCLFTIDDFGERFVINQGVGTVVDGGASQNSISTYLTRNGVKTPFEDHSVAGQMTIIGFPPISDQARLVTNEAGVDTSGAWAGGGIYTSGGDIGLANGYGILGHTTIGQGRIIARLGGSVGNRIEFGNANSGKMALGQTQPIARTGNGAVSISGRYDNTVISLAGNATSTTIIDAVTEAALSITWKQDGTGGRTYAWPTNCRFAGGSAPSDTTANTRTTVSFIYDGSNWLETSRAVAVPVT